LVMPRKTYAAKTGGKQRYPEGSNLVAHEYQNGTKK